MLLNLNPTNQHDFYHKQLICLDLLISFLDQRLTTLAENKYKYPKQFKNLQQERDMLTTARLAYTLKTRGYDFEEICAFTYVLGYRVISLDAYRGKIVRA